ncbi:MAG TPA: rhomboid family intramembrane serine protease [Chthoniobacteraceae bacterium]
MPLKCVSDPERPPSLVRAIKDHLLLLFSFLGIMWAVEFVDLLPFFDSDRYGIQPRSTSGLTGIVLAPFLHAGFEHLALNSLPFLILGGIVLLGGLAVFWKVTVFVTLVGGACVWLFAGSFSNHLGASGLIFGYLGFILARGAFKKSLLSVLIACAILVIYGGLLLGVLPMQPGVSWQGHLFGLLAGVAAARLMFSRRKTLLR